MNHYTSTDGKPITIQSNDQLQFEHVLQRDRDCWEVVPIWPYLTIKKEIVELRASKLNSFATFSSARLMQNLRPIDFAERMLGNFFGGGTNAGLGKNSRALVEGKANALAYFLLNFNEPLLIGSTPWCAEGTHFIYVDGKDIFQYEFAKLDSSGSASRSVSPHFDFAPLTFLRDSYNKNYLNGPKDRTPDLNALSKLLDDIFSQNEMSLFAASEYHRKTSLTTTSIDYIPPILSKYDRLTHDMLGQPKVEVVFALLHYEKSLYEFDSIKRSHNSGDVEKAFLHGVYCVVAAAACIEAVANRLVFLETGQHPGPNYGGTPLKKINQSAKILASRSNHTFTALSKGQPAYDAMENLRIIRNGFMHAKELESDIDPQTLSSVVHSSVDQKSCREFLFQLRNAVDYIYSQLPDHSPPIVTKQNFQWLENIEVP